VPASSTHSETGRGAAVKGESSDDNLEKYHQRELISFIFLFHQSFHPRRFIFSFQSLLFFAN
jgi:hypothetical protein